MRPLLDIDWGIHGRIKQYAIDHDLSIHEAYTKLLKIGLDSIDEK